MKKVLLVDDEAFIIKLLTRILINYVKDLSLFTAEDGEEAVSILSNENIDLVITDLQMPVMDGFELIAYIMRNFQSLPIIVLTGYSEEKLEKKLKQSSFLTLVQKHNLDFRAFSEQVTKAFMPVTKGHLEGITLFSFLQLLNLDKKTCTLTIKANGRKGFLYFSEGQLISAVCEGIESIYSAYEILIWDNAKIEIDNICRKKKNVINAALDEVLMDAFKIKDEADREKGILPLDTLTSDGLSRSEFESGSESGSESEFDIGDESLEETSNNKTYTLQQATAEVIAVPGIISYAIIDWQEQRCLAYEKTIDDNALALNLDLIKIMFTNLESVVENVLITLPGIYYLFFPSSNSQVFHLVLDRNIVDLAQVRLKLNQVARNILLHKKITTN